MAINAEAVARIMGIAEPRGRFEVEMYLTHDLFGDREVDFGVLVFTYDMKGGVVQLVSADLVTTWRRHRLRLDDLPLDFQHAMLARANRQQQEAVHEL